MRCRRRRGRDGTRLEQGWTPESGLEVGDGWMGGWVMGVGRRGDGVKGRKTPTIGGGQTWVELEGAGVGGEGGGGMAEGFFGFAEVEVVEVEGGGASGGLGEGVTGGREAAGAAVEQAEVGVVGGPVGVEGQGSLEGGDGAVEVVQTAVDKAELGVDGGHSGVAAGGFGPRRRAAEE
jgi:hypothetical protein